MITHCPDCGTKLSSFNIKEKSNEEIIFHCKDFNVIGLDSCFHYTLIFNKETSKLIYKFRIIEIEDDYYYFWSENNETKIGKVIKDKFLEEGLYIKIPEFLGEVDEVEFTKKIVKMKAFA